MLLLQLPSLCSAAGASASAATGVFLVCGGWNGGSSDAGATLGVTRCI